MTKTKFWTAHDFEPKQNFRWQVELGIEEHKFYATSATKPNFEIETKKFRNLNIKENYFGNVTWSPIIIEFVDSQHNPVLQLIRTYFDMHGFHLDSSLSEYHGFTRNDLDSYMVLELKALDSRQIEIEHWKLENCVPIKLEMSPFNYKSEDLSTYKLTIEYEWAYNQKFKEPEEEDKKNADDMLASLGTQRESIQTEVPTEKTTQGQALPAQSTPVQQDEKVKDPEKAKLDLLEKYSKKGGKRLRYRSKGPEVIQLQQALGVTPADGIWGKKTSDAIRKYQRKKGIKPLGIFGPKTFKALMEDSVVKK